jgi:hypothetical protein
MPPSLHISPTSALITDLIDREIGQSRLKQRNKGAFIGAIVDTQLIAF